MSDVFNEVNNEMSSLENNQNKNQYDPHEKSKVKIDELMKVFYMKLNYLKKNKRFTELILRLWNAIEKNTTFEISKESFISVYRKMYLFALPKYNHCQIDEFINNEFIEFSHGFSSLNLEAFTEAVFKFIHIWSTHINKHEYCYLLELVINRITKKTFSYLDGSFETLIPDIKIYIHKLQLHDEYYKQTWDPTEFTSEQDMESNIFDRKKDDENPDLIVQRPGFIEERGLYCDEDDFIIFDEDIAEYEVKNQESGKENDEKHILIFSREELLDDEEIVIFGYPTQYLLTKIKNNLVTSEALENNYSFYLNLSKSNREIRFEIAGDLMIEELFSYVLERSKIILSRNIFLLKEDAEMNVDFVDDELNIKNNLFYNAKFDRLLNFIQIVKLDKKKLIEEEKQVSYKYFANLEDLDIDKIEKIALKNLVYEDKVGIESILWNETIEEKIKYVINSKFHNVYLKIFGFTEFPDDAQTLVKVLKEEILVEKQKTKEKFVFEMTSFLNSFKSKDTYYGISTNQVDKQRHLNSDFNVITEANRKSPVILVIGPPFVGKSSLCKSMCKEMDLVFLTPEDFVLNKLQKKIALYEEANENFVEDPVDDDTKDQQADKKKRPQPKDFMTELEYQVYFDIYLDSGELKLSTLQKLYSHLIATEGSSKGVVIEHNYFRHEEEKVEENIYNKKENVANLNSQILETNTKEDKLKYFNNITNLNSNYYCKENSDDKDYPYSKCYEEITTSNNKANFRQLILSNFFGIMEIDYLIDLTISENEINKKIEDIKYFLKTGEKISKPDINLIRNPIKDKKLKYQDEEEEEGDEPQQDEPIPDEENEALPKKDDLVEILEFNKLKSKFFALYKEDREQYINYIESKRYDNCKYPIYNIKIEMGGLNSIELTKLIKNNLMFNKYPRYVAKSLDPGSHKALLTDGRESIVPFRRWSMWKDIDPVSLKDEHTILKGNPEFACEYCGKVFVFKNEENKLKFLDNTKYYLKEQPTVPSQYKIAVFGPGKSGKKTVVKMIEQLFKLKSINLEEIFNEVVEWQRNLEEPIPNNNYCSKVHFSQEEFKEWLTKKKLDKFHAQIVLMLDYLGVPIDKKKTIQEEQEERLYKRNKLGHLFFPPSNKRIKKKVEVVEEEEEMQMGEVAQNEDENPEVEGEQNEEKEPIVEKEENYDDKLDRIINQIKSEDKEDSIVEWETDSQYIDPYPIEDDYILPDHKITSMFYAYDNNFKHFKCPGFVISGLPSNEEQINKFKEFNIVFNKIIYLVDESEVPLRALLARNRPDFEKLSEEKIEEEVQKLQKLITDLEETTINLLKDKYTVNEEDPIIRINVAEPIEQVRIKLEYALNPFLIQQDDEEKSYNKEDFTPEKINMPYGEYGKFCPVTYLKDNWLFQGSGEFETNINHRRYVFATAEDQEEFKKNYRKYYNSMNYVKIPAPKIFIMSPQGGGLTTILDHLKNDFKFTEVELKKRFLELQQKLFLERKEKRVIAKRILLLKEREEAKVAKLLEDPTNKNEIEDEPDIEELLKNDEALNEEGEDFNLQEHNKYIFKTLFNSNLPSIYDANWANMSEKVPQPYQEILIETKRCPDIIVVVRTSLNKIIERNFKEKLIVDKHKELEKESKAKKQKQWEDLIVEKRKEKEANLRKEFEDLQDNVTKEDEIKFNEDLEKLKNLTVEELEIPQEEKDAIFDAIDENLIDLNIMIDEEKKKLIKQFEDDTNFINEFIEQIKARCPVIETNNDKQLALTFKHLYHNLRPYIHNRNNIIEKQLCNYYGENSTLDEPLNPELKLRKIDELIGSHVYTLGSVGKNSAINLASINSKLNYPVVYRDKIYVFNNIEERNDFLEMPLKYSQLSDIRLDQWILRNDIIYIIGSLQTGKTTIAEILASKGYYHIKVETIIADLLSRLDDSYLRKEIEDCLLTGKTMHDNLLVRCIHRRVNMWDLVGKNLVFDGIPFTQSQLKDLESIGLSPTLVIQMECSDKVQFDRAFRRDNILGYKVTVLEQINNYKFHSNVIYNNYFGRKLKMIKLNSEKSKWQNEVFLMNYLEKRNKQFIDMNINMNKDSSCLINELISPDLKQMMISTLDDINFYSPVSLRTNTKFIFNKFNTEFLVYYKSKFFFLNNQIEVDLFNKHPDIYYNYLKQIKFDIVPAKRLTLLKLAETILTQKVVEYQNCCPVTYLEKGIIKEGNELNICEYKGKIYQMLNNKALRKFQENPEKYCKQTIPVKTTTDKIEPGVPTNVDIEQTVTYLETNFGGIITKGMLELASIRIKYPYIDVSETSIKYLALFLKSNNLKNNEYSKFKFNEKFKYFLRSSLLPFELLNVYNKYKEAQDGSLKKKLLLREMEKLSVKYDELMEEAKNHKNTRFKEFF